jgi:N-acetylneuraminic acid mutarotase
MKTLTNNFCGLTKKNIKFYPNSLFGFVLIQILLTSVLSGIITASYAQSPYTQKTDMPISSNAQSSCVLDGKIYVLGGQNGKRKLLVFDPVSNSWTSKVNMKVERVHLSSCVFNDKILAIGGTQGFYKYPKITIEEYDPVADTWTIIDTMPRARIDHTASLVNGKIYIIGGGDDDYVCFPEVDVFDPLTNEWTSAADMLTPRMCLEAVVLNSKIYAIGGMEGLLNGESGETTMEMYDPATDTWTTKAGMNIKRKYFTACVLNGKIYVIGGAEGYCGPLIASVEEYDPETDSWKEMADFPKNLAGGSAASLDGKIFVSGGHVKACPTNTTSFMYEYDPTLDLFPLIEKTEIDKRCVKAGTDSVFITTKMRDPTSTTLLAEIEAPDQTPVDSLQLFDDGNHNDGNAGDSLYANVWPVSSAEEHHYYLDLVVTRIENDTVIHHINNIVTFSTDSLVTLKEYNFTSDDTEPNPGDRIKLEITLKNNSSIATAKDIEARLISLDTLVRISKTFIPFGDIAAGENSISKMWVINISEECPVNTEVHFAIDISSDDYIFWSDTFPILVQEPSNIEEIREPLTRIYPNPTGDMLNIEINNTGNQVLEIEMLTISGQVIYQKEYKNIGIHFTEQLDLSSYTKGIYLVKVRKANSVYTGKLVVK